MLEDLYSKGQNSPLGGERNTDTLSKFVNMID